MSAPASLMPVLILVLAGLALPADASHCGTAPENPHSYALALSVSAGVSRSSAIGAGYAQVFDNNTFDCDGNGLPDDFDGDYEFGLGGGYFGIDSEANAKVNNDCGLGLHLHPGTTVRVTDVMDAFFAAGYEGFHDVTETYCENDGVIGDDFEDCLKEYVNSAPVDPCGSPPGGCGWPCQGAPQPATKTESRAMISEGSSDLFAGTNVDAGIWIFIETAVVLDPMPEASSGVMGTITVE